MYGYDIRNTNTNTYSYLLGIGYFRDDKRWCPVDSTSAPIASTLDETIAYSDYKQMQQNQQQDQNSSNDRQSFEYNNNNNNNNIPLIFTNRVIEYNNTIESYIKAYTASTSSEASSNNNNNNDQNNQSKETVSKLRVINSHGIIRNKIGGYQLLTDKFTLAKTLSRSKYHIPSILIENAREVCSFINHGNQQQQQQQQQQQSNIIDDNDDKIWFLKDPCLAKGEGIQLFKCKQEALSWIKSDERDSNKRYILQKEVTPMLLSNGFKFDVRVNILLTFNHLRTDLYLFNECIVRSTSCQYHKGNIDKQSQLTNLAFQKKIDNSFKSIYRLSSSIDHDSSMYNHIKEAIINIFKGEGIIEKLNQTRHKGFTLFGLDFIFDVDGNPFLLEINYNPSMFLNTGDETISNIFKEAINKMAILAIDPLLPSSTKTKTTLESPSSTSIGEWEHCLQYVYPTELSNQDQLDNFNLFA